MTKEELAQDLAYVRTLAEEGRHAPLVGGSFLVLWGVLLGVAYTLQWLLLQDILDDGGGVAYGWLWIGYGGLGLLGVLWLARRVRRKPGTASIVNRVDRLLWRTAGMGIGVVSVACIIRMFVAHDEFAPNAIMATAFALFAVPLGTTAAISNHSWLYWYSMLSFAVSAVLWINLNEPWAYLLAAVASLVVLALPGAIMMRREPSDVV